MLAANKWILLFLFFSGAVVMVELKERKNCSFEGQGKNCVGRTRKRGHKFEENEEKMIMKKEIREKLFNSIDPSRIAKTLRAVTQHPHQAGTEENRKVAEMLVELWRENGLEGVRLMEYEVLLSYPDWTTPNHASVLGEDGKILFQSIGLSPDLINKEKGDNDYKASLQWLAYSGNGTALGEPIYCNYGRPIDFGTLEKEFGISSLKGKIALIRYGEDYRGDKVKHAQDRGAAGVILFSDPAEVAPFGQEAVFPSTDQLPSVGVQRGSLLEWNGDPLTPLLPSRRDIFKQKTIEQLKKERLLPEIPVLPIGFGDAMELLSRMGGQSAPAEWQGGLNIDYKIGPGFQKEHGLQLQIDVHSTLEVKTIQNVLGIIPGREEPDSWVLLGNHYDAWVYGALDPNSGTAILAEVARAFVETIRQSGWRPRRTIVFCNWDGEEHALLGSTEFVQEFAGLLSDRAVVYLNVDYISANETLDVHTVPTLYQAVVDAAKVVSNPMREEHQKGRETLYDTWSAHFPPPKSRSWLPGVPSMKIPGGSSDHYSFLNFLGIPVVDFRYRNASWSSYALYHSRYEVPFVNEHIFDHNNMAVHKAVGEYWAELALSFADDSYLPINASIFASIILKEYLRDVKTALLDLHAKFPDETQNSLQQMHFLEKQAIVFAKEANKFERARKEKNIDPGRANRRLRRLDQCFVNPGMGPASSSPELRNVLYSLSADNTYAATVMSSIYGKITELATELTYRKKREKLDKELAVQLSVVQYSILCASNELKQQFL